MRKALYTIIIIIAICLAATVGGSFYMLNFSLSPDANRRDTDSAYALLFKRMPNMEAWTDSVISNDLLKDTFVTMENGEHQHAIYMKGDSAHGRTAIIIHGYKDNAIKFLYMGRMYNRDLGYNILMPDLHAHGLSDGDAIQMGWKDRKDIVRWAQIAESIFRDSTSKSSIIIHGVSMGAATTMNVSGDTLPPYIKCFVEDCGYTSVWDEFACQLKDIFSLPSFPLMYTTSLLCNIKYGWSFGEASPLKQVAKCHKPMLFIHGDKDSFVPTWMVYPLYKAKPGEKELWITHGSKHAQSYRDRPAEYTKRIKAFATKWISNRK